MERGKTMVRIYCIIENLKNGFKKRNLKNKRNIFSIYKVQTRELCKKNKIKFKKLMLV